MDVSGVYGSIPQVDTSSSKPGSTPQDAKALQMDFLKMLTAQLQYQDPLEPLANTEFTAQMAQFSSLGEQQQGNELLRQLISMQSVSQLNNAVGYMGKQVVVEGDRTEASNGEATVRFDLPENGMAAINLYTANGQLVKALPPQSFKSGEQSFTVRDDGLPNGPLNFTVSLLSEESAALVTTYEAGEVTGLVNDPTGGVSLQVNGRSVNLADVRRVEQIQR